MVLFGGFGGDCLLFGQLFGVFGFVVGQCGLGMGVGQFGGCLIVFGLVVVCVDGEEYFVFFYFLVFDIVDFVDVVGYVWMQFNVLYCFDVVVEFVLLVDLFDQYWCGVDLWWWWCIVFFGMVVVVGCKYGRGED